MLSFKAGSRRHEDGESTMFKQTRMGRTTIM